jgi:hypothetical protein
MPALLLLDTLSFDLSHSPLLSHDLRTRTTLVGTIHVYNPPFSSLQMYRHLSVRVFEVSRVLAIPFSSLFFSLLAARAPTLPLDPAGPLVASSSSSPDSHLRSLDHIFAPSLRHPSLPLPSSSSTPSVVLLHSHLSSPPPLALLYLCLFTLTLGHSILSQQHHLHLKA